MFKHLCQKVSNGQIFWFILIIFIALLLRLVRLDVSPARLTSDEMSIGYNAYSILKTGTDEWGRKFPLVFQAFGDFKLPAYIYLAIPFIATLGLNALSLKLLSVVAGIIIVFAIYLIVKEITNNKTPALIAASLAAISPWPVHLSRTALESNLSLAFFSLGFYFLLKTISKAKTIHSIASGIFLGLTFYSYVAYRLIVALFMAILLIDVFLKQKLKKPFILIVIVAVITVLPIIGVLFGNGGMARFSQVSLFRDEGIAAIVNEDRAFCFLQNQTILPKLCHPFFNKFGTIGIKFLDNYAKFISPTFLFIEGDQLQYLSNPGFGEFFIIFIPFYLIGIYQLFKQNSVKANLTKILFLLSPMPSALAGEPQIVRGSALIPFICLFIALGIFQSYRYLKAKSLHLVFSLGLAIFTLLLLVQYTLSYWYIYPANFDNAASALNPQIGTFLKEHESAYDLISVSNYFTDAHIFLAFYLQKDPIWYQQNAVRPPQDSFGFSHPIALGKYVFEDQTLQHYVCNSKYQKVLYLTNKDEGFKPYQEFRSFSGVHLQTAIYDVDYLRQWLQDRKQLESYCK
ncbi:phospholipid carrier-dependent glycosyltransferase [Candidatus Beckwithbacteria bacterium]|nr:phospholipid carrier-dependent glycosyltransferase [Candidatus Beckwithbacteria bacterium]